MQGERPERIITFLDDDLEDAVKGLSDAEMLAYAQKIYDYMSQNPGAFPGITTEALDELKKFGADFKDAVEKSKIADREAAIATAKMESSADAVLAAFAKVDKSRGN